MVPGVWAVLPRPATQALSFAANPATVSAHPSPAAGAPVSRRWWRWVLAVVAVTACGWLFLAPPRFVYDPAPLVQAMALSARTTPPPTRGRQRSVRIVGVRVWDASHATPSEPTELLVVDGHIRQVGKAALPHSAGNWDEVEVLHGSGLYAWPGLTDAHAHVSFAPGAALRNDNAETSRRLRHHHLASLVASGVTTVLDPAVDDQVALETLAWLAAGQPGPRYLHLGPPLATPHGYLDGLFETVHNPAEVPAALERVQRSGAVGIKMTVERGMLADIWEVHSLEVMSTVRNAAQARGLRIFLHAMTDAAARTGMTLHPAAMVHHARDASAGLVALLAEQHIPVITTLNPWEAHTWMMERRYLQDPQVALVTPPAVLATLADPQQQANYMVGILGETLPFLPSGLRNVMGAVGRTRFARSVSRRVMARHLAQASDSVMRMHRAGVMMVLGSDSGNWPLFPNMLHGPSTWQEVDLLERAGFKPHEVLAMATVNAARLLELEDREGLLRTGMKANVLLTRQDPSQGISNALRSLVYVVADGEAHTPQQWMTLAPQPPPAGRK